MDHYNYFHMESVCFLSKKDHSYLETTKGQCVSLPSFVVLSDFENLLNSVADDEEVVVDHA